LTRGLLIPVAEVWGKSVINASCLEKWLFSISSGYIVQESRFHPLVLASLAAHDLEERSPEPFDRATDEALSLEQQAEMATFELLEEEAFDPALRSNGAVVRRDDGLRLHVRRDSPEYFFLSRDYLSESRAEPGLLMRKDRAYGCSVSVTITAVALGLVVLYRLLIS
jgi:hypothetical protein